MPLLDILPMNLERDGIDLRSDEWRYPTSERSGRKSQNRIVIVCSDIDVNLPFYYLETQLVRNISTSSLVGPSWNSLLKILWLGR